MKTARSFYLILGKSTLSGYAEPIAPVSSLSTILLTYF